MIGEFDCNNNGDFSDFDDFQIIYSPDGFFGNDTVAVINVGGSTGGYFSNHALGEATGTTGVYEWQAPIVGATEVGSYDLTSCITNTINFKMTTYYQGLDDELRTGYHQHGRLQRPDGRHPQQLRDLPAGGQQPGAGRGSRPDPGRSRLGGGPFGMEEKSPGLKTFCPAQPVSAAAAALTGLNLCASFSFLKRNEFNSSSFNDWTVGCAKSL